MFHFAACQLPHIATGGVLGVYGFSRNEAIEQEGVSVSPSISPFTHRTRLFPLAPPAVVVIGFDALRSPETPLRRKLDDSLLFLESSLSRWSFVPHSFVLHVGPYPAARVRGEGE